jgi:hypothetical protein
MSLVAAGHPASPTAETAVGDRERAERWARVIVAVLALTSVAPFAYLVGEAYRDSLTERLLTVNDWIPADGDLEAKLQNGAGLLGAPVLIAAVLVFVGLMWLRRRRGEQGIDDGSLALTVGAWAVLFVATAFVGTLFVVAGGENTSDVAQAWIDNPGWLLLTPAGFVAAVAMSLWYHRRRYGLAPVGRRRIAAPPPEPGALGPPALGEGLRLYAKAWVIEIGFGVAALGQMLVSDDDAVPFADFVAEWFFTALLFPALIIAAFLVLLRLLRPTRWLVGEIFSRPLIRWCLAALGVGVVLVLASDALPGWLAVVGIVLVIGAAAVAGITGLYVQDLGPQPWLGILFLGLVYVSSAFTTEHGDLALPTGAFAWGMAVALGAYLVWEVRGLWREHQPGMAAAA